jgi:hypothetical protein
VKRKSGVFLMVADGIYISGGILVLLIILILLFWIMR